MTVTYNICFEDLDWETWVRGCGAEVVSLEPLGDGSYELTIDGNGDAIETFSKDLGYGPQ